MRCWMLAVVGLSVGLATCGETPGADQCGYQGQGGGGAFVYSGLYEARWSDGAWNVAGSWSYDDLHVSASRTSDGVVCNTHAAYPADSECFLLSGETSSSLCLIRG